MKMKNKKNTKFVSIAALLLAGLMLVSLTGCGAGDEAPNGAEASGNVDSGMFREMDAEDLNGNKLDGSVFKNNKLTMVNVWNLGCTPCIQEIPHLGEINDAYKDKGVAVMGLYYNFSEAISDKDKAEIEKLMKDAKAQYPHIEPSAKMYSSDELMNLQAFPTTFFVNAEGKIVEKVEGSRDFDGWKQVVDRVLKGVDADA